MTGLPDGTKQIAGWGQTAKSDQEKTRHFTETDNPSWRGVGGKKRQLKRNSSHKSLPFKGQPLLGLCLCPQHVGQKLEGSLARLVAQFYESGSKNGEQPTSEAPRHLTCAFAISKSSKQNSTCLLSSPLLLKKKKVYAYEQKWYPAPPLIFLSEKEVHNPFWRVLCFTCRSFVLLRWFGLKLAFFFPFAF